MSDAEILSSTEVAAAAPNPAYCLAVGRVGADVEFELRLPQAWNGKLFMAGNGGFAGSFQNRGTEDAVRRGYAAVQTDTGHKGITFDASWALNHWERQVNFGFQGVHLAAQAAKEAVTAYYGEDIQRSYFNGCSRGGGQAMMESQLYPDDFDGLIAGAPGYDWTGGLGMAFAWNQQALYPDPANPTTPLVPTTKFELLQTAVLQKCDALDGVADGLLNDPRECSFDPALDLPRCEGDVDGPGCFTTAQIAALKRVYDGLSNSSGQIYPGFPPGNEADPVGWGLFMHDSPLFRQVYGVDAPNAQYQLMSEILRNFVYGDPAYDFRKFNFETDVRDTLAAGLILNAKDPDLHDFKSTGGKMIMYHGWSDGGVTALGTIQYYDQVAAKMGGLDRTKEFNRLFLMPGMGHCSGGAGPDTVDWLTVLENWVEKGEAPDRVIASHLTKDKVVDRTRPLCPYPQVAVWKGTGSTDEAANFVCQNP